MWSKILQSNGYIINIISQYKVTVIIKVNNFDKHIKNILLINMQNYRNKLGLNVVACQNLPLDEDIPERRRLSSLTNNFGVNYFKLFLKNQDR